MYTATYGVSQVEVRARNLEQARSEGLAKLRRQGVRIPHSQLSQVVTQLINPPQD